jgi:tetratricopeptide (TPR) repeat protein
MRGRVMSGTLLAILLTFAAATAAEAQIGTLRGRVVDEAGKPVPDAEVTLDYLGEQKLSFTVKTNNNGEWVRAGLRAVGRWTISVRKGTLVGRADNVSAPLSTAATVPDIVIRPGSLDAVAPADAAAAAEQAELVKAMTEANAAMTAGNYDLVISRFTELTAKRKNCAACFVRIGDAYQKKNDAAAAEKAYLSAIDVGGTTRDAADAYGALAILYNQQGKLADASKMSQKETELRGASGGGDATSLFNSAAILWNQGKVAEAKAQFLRVIELNPKLADAHYYLGMCLVSENKPAEARAAMEQYLKLAPTGENAAMAKTVLESIK